MDRVKRRTLFTDGEGPLVFKDMAFDLSARIRFDDQHYSGRDLFEILSFYDDYLAEVGTSGYQAGDTLALVVPHYLIHGLTDRDVQQEAKDVRLVAGVKKCISQLKGSGWNVRVISTAYRPLWELVGKELSIPQKDIACTDLDLGKLRLRFGIEEFDEAVKRAEGDLLAMATLVGEAQREVDSGQSVVKVLAKEKYSSFKERADQFYWREIPNLGYQPLKEVRVMGGKRKVLSARQFAKNLQVGLCDVIYVGDSITDCELFREVNRGGGLSVAVNGNYYALRDARVAVATENMQTLLPLLEAWGKRGWDGVEDLVSRDRQFKFCDEANSDEFSEIVALHKKSRGSVRGNAAKLG